MVTTISVSCVVVTPQAIQGDEAMGQRGLRKVCAIRLWREEHEIQDPLWVPGAVQVVGRGGLETSVACQVAAQDRHLHQQDEVYVVTSGAMHILVQGNSGLNSVQRFVVPAGGHIKILPGSIHQVLRVEDGGEEFQATVIAPNSLGDEGKFVQLVKGGDWVCWAGLNNERRASAFRWNPSDYPVTT